MLNNDITQEDIMYVPASLQAGDQDALIAPSGSIGDGAHVDYAVEFSRRLGLVPVEGASCRKINGHLAGTEAERAADFNWAFGDPDIKGVFCIRGGNGAAKILDKIDFDLIRANPKGFYGYSDISVLHAAINQRTGLITYHTPMLAEPNFQQADVYTLDQHRRYIFDPGYKGGLELPEGNLDFLVEGTAEGMLCGGNLAALSGTMGTPYEIDTRGKIFFIEEVGQSPPHIDRRLNGFRLAGKLSHCAGIIFGQFTNCAGAGRLSLDVEAVIRSLGLTVPVIWNFPCGHELPTTSLPMGAVARMDSRAGTLTIV